MRQRVPRAVWLIAGLVAALLVIPAAANANSFPGNGDSTVADNDLHTYCYTSGFTTDRSVASYAMSGAREHHRHGGAVSDEPGDVRL